MRGRAKRRDPAPKGQYKKKRIMGWQIQNNINLTVTHKGRQLQVGCTPIQGTTLWAILALEGPMKIDEDLLPGDHLKTVLNDHKHESLGTAEGMKAAMDLAEAYADKWQRNAIKTGGKCDCPTISPMSNEKFRQSLEEGKKLADLINLDVPVCGKAEGE